MVFPVPRVELVADVNQFLGGMTKARTSMKETEVAAKGGLGSAMAAAETSFNRLMTSGGGLASSLGKVGEATGLAMSGTTVAVAGTAIAAGTIIKFGKDAVEAYQNLAGEIRRFKLVSGASAEDSSKLVAAFNALGVDSDRVGTAVFRLSKNLDGSHDALTKYGVEIAHAKSGNVDMANTFLNVADAVHKAGAGQEANAIVAAAFGVRIGKELLPALLRGREGLDEFYKAAAARGEIFNDKDLQKSKELSLNMRELGINAKAFEVQAGRQMVPVLADLTGGLSAASLAVDDQTRKVGGLATYMRAELATATGGLSEGLIGLGRDHKTAAAAAQLHAEEERKTAEEEDKAAKKVDALRSALEGNINAQQSAATANRNITDASTQLAQATDKLADLQRKGAVDVKAVATANKAHEDAIRSVTQAQQQADTAQQHVNDLMAKGAVDAKAVASAERELERAADSATTARERLSDAEKKLADVRKGATPLEKEQASLRADDATDNVATAEQHLFELRSKGVATTLELHRAENAIKQAKIDQQRATDDLNKVNKQGADGADDTVAAQRGVVDATRSLEQAQDSEGAAAEKLRLARAGDPTFEQTLAAAKQGAADASDRVRQAQDREKETGDKLREARLGDPEFDDKVKKAKDDVAKATERLNTAQGAGMKAAFDAADAFDKEQKNIGASADQLARLRGELDTMARVHPEASAYIGLLRGQLPLEPLSPTMPGRGGTAGPGTGPGVRSTADISLFRAGERGSIGQPLGVAGPGGNAQPWQYEQASRDIVIQVDGKELGRITQTHLLQQGRNNTHVLTN